MLPASMRKSDGNESWRSGTAQGGRGRRLVGLLGNSLEEAIEHR